MQRASKTSGIWEPVSALARSASAISSQPCSYGGAAVQRGTACTSLSSSVAASPSVTLWRQDWRARCPRSGGRAARTGRSCRSGELRAPPPGAGPGVAASSPRAAPRRPERAGRGQRAAGRLPRRPVAGPGPGRARGTGAAAWWPSPAPSRQGAPRGRRRGRSAPAGRPARGRATRRRCPAAASAAAPRPRPAVPTRGARRIARMARRGKASKC